MRREFSLDLIRSMAILLVMVDHTFKLGDMSFPQASIRSLSLAGVPLFLMLTGYLNNHKTLDDYYVCGKWRTSLRILFAYVVLGSVCYVGGNMFDGKAVTIKDFILKLLAFRLTPYGWYIEMWVGLFFLTPFLNMIVAQFTRKSERILLTTMLFFTCLASFFNRNGTNLLPNFWVTLYPITIYFLGHYVSQYRVALSRFVCLGYILLIMIGEPLLNRLFHTDNYLYFWGGQDDIIYVTLGLILFIMMKDVKLKNVKMGGLIKKISKVSLHMYLISYLFDHIWHCIIAERFFVAEPLANFPWYFVIFILSFICTLCVSLIYEMMEKNIFKS